MTAIGDPFAKEVEAAPGAPEDLFARESRIRDATRELLDVGDSARLIAQAHGLGEEPLFALRESWRRWLGVASGFDHARHFGLILPSLRLAAITAPGVQPWPRVSRALPPQLLAASFYMELSARAGRPITIRSIAEVWRSTTSVRAVLARWDERRQLPDAPLAPGTAAEVQAAYTRVQASPLPLGAALEAADIEPALRPVVLRALADRLY
jgi:hypothetical protein